MQASKPFNQAVDAKETDPRLKRAKPRSERLRSLAARAACGVLVALAALLALPLQTGAQTLSTDATLSDLALEGATGSEPIPLSPVFDSATETYTTAVANRIDAMTLTATKTNANATVAITNDGDTSTPGTAELNLSVGSNTVTVTVTAESGAMKTYTITVTRANAPPAPTDCPADTDWCTTMGVGYTSQSALSFYFEYWGYRSGLVYGDLHSTTFTHDGDSYTVSRVDYTRITESPGNTVTINELSLVISPELPKGTILQLGSRTFTVDIDSTTTTPRTRNLGRYVQPAELDSGPVRHSEPEVSRPHACPLYRGRKRQRERRPPPVRRHALASLAEHGKGRLRNYFGRHRHRRPRLPCSSQLHPRHSGRRQDRADGLRAHRGHESTTTARQ